MKENYPMLPENVTDQIYLWEVSVCYSKFFITYLKYFLHLLILKSEMKVLDPKPAIMINEFESEKEYSEIVQFASLHKCILWKEKEWAEGKDNKLILAAAAWEKVMKPFIISRKK
jgi:hypothetical protein